MPDSLSGPLTFDRGIEGILYEEVTASALPQGNKVLPTEEQMVHQLDDLMRSQSLDRLLLDSMRPELSDREMLIHQNFHSALGEIHSQLESDQDLAASSELKSLLDNEREVMGLYRTYTNLLHRG